MAKRISTGRSRGHIRQRGNPFQVLVYAGNDPLTGKEIRLTASARTEPEAKAILKRFRAQVDEQRHAKTNATFRVATEAWLRTHDEEFYAELRRGAVRVATAGRSSSTARARHTSAEP